MKVIKLIAENVKGLKAVEISPDEHFQLVSGKNGQGKSSVLDSIWYALGGGKALEGTDKPIRDGAEKASVTLDLGDIIVSRKWANGNTSLDVRTKDGAKFTSPQKMLDDMIGRLSFDPLAFCNLDDAKQKATLQELVGFDPKPLDTERKAVFEERTIVNREVKAIESQLAGLGVPPVGVPNEEVSVSAVMQELKAAQEVKAANDKKRIHLQSLSDGHKVLKASIEDIDQQILRLQEVRASKVAEMKMIGEEGRALKEEVAGLVDPDLTAIEQKLGEVDTINQKVRSKAAYNALQLKLDEKQATSQKLTEQINAIDARKEAALKEAQFPIEGLGFGEEGVTFNGIPFRQCCSAERLKVSMAMAMAMNPKVRIIRILDGSLLDQDNLAVIHEMAKEKDFQVWIEVVDSSGTVGVYIEDGQVVAAH